ncbi:MAG TPA: serine hydrolase domain-containing protein [Kofleriaceae bacterium]|jgi:CubicO group peptidase (beta-lactamase class C family)|nr:serine hydrolase domain-containing protein [Kofleriaceae bacterium]
MHRLAALAWFLIACHGGAAAPPATLATPPVAAAPAAPLSTAPAPALPAASPPERLTASPPERLTADTPETTVGGATFVAPAQWSISVRGPATILEAPEAGSQVALVDVQAKDADAAVAAAWAAYKPDARWPLKLASDAPDKDGWSKIRAYAYQTSPNEHRLVVAFSRLAGDTWTVAIGNLDEAVAEKRGGQLGVITSRLFPKGHVTESFAGVPAAKLDAAKLAALGAFVDQARTALGVPSVSIGVIQDGKIVFAGGFGTRELGGKPKADADTLYMIASSTKAMTTLMLAKLVEAGKLTWDTPVTTLLPSFKLGDADTTRKVMVKHLICACTGLPRQDYEWQFEFKDATPASVLATLATIQPTSRFGELFQYSNSLAGAAGFVGGHVVYPKLELGAAYDKAMQALVFDPLGMTSTTFDFGRALRANHAGAYATDIDGKPAPAVMGLNYAAIPLRPAGGAWSSVRDILKYVQMELASGALPSGKRYIAAEPLLARRAPQVAMSKDETYGMGLVVDTRYGTPVVHHGGNLIGYHSEMLWLPEHHVGAVILTNGDAGVLIRGPFRRKLLELLFDGHPEADADMAASVKTYFDEIAAERKLITVPGDPAEVAKLAPHYTSATLGDITVKHTGAATVFDLGEWQTEVGSRKNPDGSISFITTAPGITGFEFVVGTGAKRTLIVRDAQHSYTFTEG